MFIESEHFVCFLTDFVYGNPRWNKVKVLKDLKALVFENLNCRTRLTLEQTFEVVEKEYHESKLNY